MEEILASIRRIISEEEQAPAAPEPVLDLTVAEEAELEPDDDIVFEAAPEPPPAPMVAPAAPAAPADPIISPPTASAAAGSLARLAGTLRIADTPGQTIEGVVRELLKPMLKDWLDHHLPAIVESRVEAELERIARMAR
ncbi:MAG TPA: DUF2497 domain-containing protein [Hyphomonadaceae bacterium]|nr:DUF2497 domain-containing protein [Hyphomonadaceae bacterium]